MKDHEGCEGKVGVSRQKKKEGDNLRKEEEKKKDKPSFPKLNRRFQKARTKRTMRKTAPPTRKQPCLFGKVPHALAEPKPD